ncbi:MAG TPA: TadE family protein [Nonomuraea sp.]|nr:TadE family protein [Nonomuraea sp.]
MISRRPRRPSGQALVETALAIPILLMLVFAIIAFGLYVFYNQQLANAAREAARYAAVNSSTAQCPTVSRLDPPDTLKPRTYVRCDAPENGWPQMTAAARTKVWGIAPTQVSISACWSGYVDALNNHDSLPQAPNVFTDCTIQGVNPRTDPANIACPAPATVPSGLVPQKANGDDKASDIAVATGNNLAYPTVVTVYACMVWAPPLAGFVLIPSQVTLRAVISEALQRQQ